MILGKTWLERVEGIVDTGKQVLTLAKYGISVRSTELESTILSCTPISAASFQAHVRRNKRIRGTFQVFAAGLKDIEKALEHKAPLTEDDVRGRLPGYLQPYVSLFLPRKVTTFLRSEALRSIIASNSSCKMGKNLRYRTAPYTTCLAMSF